MNPAQARRERHERAAKNGEGVIVRRQGEFVGVISFKVRQGWKASLANPGITLGFYHSAISAEMAIIDYATAEVAA
jgi:hypothetical protein